MLGEQTVRTGMWAIIDATCDINALGPKDDERGVTLTFGGRHDFVELTFEGDAIDRLIDAATSSRDRLRGQARPVAVEQPGNQ
jgi:hypothetical protein